LREDWELGLERVKVVLKRGEERRGDRELAGGT